ncbi:hypothetical protein B0H14DRAFT_3063268 [Mycena olivaceomarginata]|nr:hypothetical protein B0H14DRAFT_3063268 [Mycena olivaceomarginata]
MINPTDPLVQLKITSATCIPLSLCVGLTDPSTRLYKRSGRFWADDACALFAFVSLIIQVVSVFLHVPVPNNLTKTARVSAYYLMALTFYSIIWTSRLSILFSIIRIHPSPSARKHLFWVAVSFVTARPVSLWAVALADVLSDSILLFAPLQLFRTLADKMLRRKLTLIFSTCVVTTIVSLVHAAFILRNGGIKVVISAIVEDCLSLIVANVPVVVAAVMPHNRETDEVQTLETRSMRFNPVPRKRYTTRGTDPVMVAMNTIKEEHSDFTSTSELKGDKVFTWNRDDAPKWV